jgi:prepilin-type N-terminal cleavage/methylation domain-containing protein
MNIHLHGHARGFTLIELLVVISIIGMLSSIVMVSLQSARDKGRIGAGQKFDSSTYHAFGADAALIYDFDDGAIPPTDIASNGNILGSCASTISTPSVPIKNKALTLSAGCNSGTFPYKKFSSSNGSVSFWLYPTSYSAVLSKNIAHIKGLWIGLDTLGSIVLSGALNGTGSKVLPLNVWSHVFISWGSGKTDIYIDGKFDNSLSLPVFSGTSFYLGSYDAGSTQAGYLDQFSIYTQSIQNP